jgi:DNA-directed RNA polymerase specialized sigma24 family protein
LNHVLNELSEQMREHLFLEQYESIRRIADFRAGLLVNTRGFGIGDREDICQELLLHVWNQLPQFDARRSSIRTFACHIVARRTISIARYNFAARRNPRLLSSSLSEVLADNDVDSREYPHWVCSACSAPRIDHGAIKSAQRHEFWRDVDLALTGLPVAIWDAAIALSHSSPAELSRTTGRSRTSLYRVMTQIRKAFSDAGIQPNYFCRLGA